MVVLFVHIFDTVLEKGRIATTVKKKQHQKNRWRRRGRWKRVSNSMHNVLLYDSILIRLGSYWSCGSPIPSIPLVPIPYTLWVKDTLNFCYLLINTFLLSRGSFRTRKRYPAKKLMMIIMMKITILICCFLIFPTLSLLHSVALVQSHVLLGQQKQNTIIHSQ